MFLTSNDYVKIFIVGFYDFETTDKFKKYLK